MPSMLVIARVGLRGAGRAGGRPSGPGSVGFRGWSCLRPLAAGQPRRRWRPRRRRRCGCACGCRPNDELHQLCQDGPCVDSLPGDDVTGLAGARQDCDGTHSLALDGQAPTSGQQRRLRAASGSGGRTSQSPDTTRVSHSKSHAHRHRSQPGSSPNHRAVSQSFHLALLDPSGAYWLDDPPDLSCGMPQYAVDGPRLSCNSRGGVLAVSWVGRRGCKSSGVRSGGFGAVSWGRLVDEGQ